MLTYADVFQVGNSERGRLSGTLDAVTRERDQAMQKLKALEASAGMLTYADVC
jgi:hypothetical protein